MPLARQLWSRIAVVDPFAKDAALTAGIALLALIELVPLRGFDGWEQPPPAAWPALALAVIAPLAWRRRNPLAALTIQAVAEIASVLITGHLGFSVFVSSATLIGAYSGGAYAEQRRWSLAVVLTAGLTSGLALGVSRFLGGIPGFDAVVLLIPWLIGTSVRAQRRLVASLKDRALQLERERDATARAAVAEERARIARELHDVVAHSVSVMVVQAEAARRLVRRRPDDAQDAMRTVSNTGSEALQELKHLLGVLGDGAQPGLEPAPGLRDIDAMLARLRAAGLHVDLQVEGAAQPLSRGLELTAYRIVQEALTNVLRHAQGSAAQVRLRYGGEGLEIEVVDAGSVTSPPSAGGRGLIGMKQRVDAYGGQLQAGPRTGGGYAVRVRLPLEAAT